AANQNRKAGNLFEAHAGNPDIVGVFDQNAVVDSEPVKRRVGIRQTGALLDRAAIAIESKVPKADARTGSASEDCPAPKIVSGSQNRPRPADLHIVRLVRQSQLRVDFDNAGRKLDGRAGQERLANSRLGRQGAASQKAKGKSQ